MPKMTRILALYAIISGFAMLVLWSIFFAVGIVADELSYSPFSFPVLLAAESLTVLLLLIGGFGILTRREWAPNLTMVSLGMMLYAVIYGAGNSAQRGNLFLTCFFALISVATALLLFIKFFCAVEKNEN
jgi:hypothetical protein